jgi:hypothetical protein
MQKEAIASEFHASPPLETGCTRLHEVPTQQMKPRAPKFLLLKEAKQCRLESPKAGAVVAVFATASLGLGLRHPSHLHLKFATQISGGGRDSVRRQGCCLYAARFYRAHYVDLRCSTDDTRQQGGSTAI